LGYMEAAVLILIFIVQPSSVSMMGTEC
jgi:hypothetical protein